jgi:small subunit ribosomal protein S20
MANHKSAKKRIRSNERKRIRNKAALSKVASVTKNVLDNKEADKADELLKSAVSTIDKTVSKGRLHRNTASRKKAALTKHVNKLKAAK